MTFKGYQEWFRAYDAARGLGEEAATVSLTHLVEEIGEIARHVLDLEGHRTMEGTEREREIRALALELSDAFVFLTKIANCYGIEWDETIERAIEKAESRWPLLDEQREVA